MASGWFAIPDFVGALSGRNPLWPVERRFTFQPRRRVIRHNARRNCRGPDILRMGRASSKAGLPIKRRANAHTRMGIAVAKTQRCGHHIRMGRIAIRLGILLGLFIPALFLPAGRVDLPFFWVYLGLLLMATAAASRLIDPDLLRERVHPGPGGLDRNLRFHAIPFIAAHLIVAGLDVGRFHWSGPVPIHVQWTSMVFLGTSMGLSMWAMRANRFFSPVVRIQAERGHHLVTSGPYRWVRHPGYAAALTMMLVGGPALGSWWAMAPMIPLMMLILRRVVIEDRFLRGNLEGYEAYARQVRYRIIPGLW